MKFFVAPQLKRIRENIGLTNGLYLMGYSYRWNYFNDDLEEAGLYEEYCENPNETIQKLNISMDYDNHKLAALFDTEDGPVGVYIKPETALAKQLETVFFDMWKLLDDIAACHDIDVLWSNNGATAWECLAEIAEDYYPPTAEKLQAMLENGGLPDTEVVQ